MDKRVDQQDESEGIMREKAALYYRKSTHEQTGSIERQRSQVELYTKQHGYKVVGTYADEGIAGNELAKRKDFQQLLRDAKAGKFDVIVADELSRISRQDIVEFIGTVVLPLQRAGVRIETMKDGPQEWDDVVKIIMLAVRQSKSRDESINLSRRVITGMLTAAKSGRKVAGKVAYGYTRDAVSGKLVPINPRADIAKEAFRRVAADETLWNIARDLNARNIPSPRGKKWCAGTIAHLIRNRAYVGDAVWGKRASGKYYKIANGQAVPRRVRRIEQTAKTEWIIVPDAHEPLVDRATFDAANRAVDRRSRTGGRAPHKSPNPEAYVFSSLLACGHCGYAMCGLLGRTRQRVRCKCGWRGTAWRKPGVISRPCGQCGAPIPIKDGGEMPSIYVCNGMKRYGHAVCRSHSIAEVQLLHIIGADLETLIGSPEKRKAAIVRTLTERAYVNPARLAECRAALADVTAKLQEGARRFLDVPQSFADEIAAAMEALKAEQLRLTEEVKALQGNAVDPEQIEALADDIVSHLRLLRWHLVSGERSKVRAIVQRFVERITVSFNRSAPRLDAVESVRVKYREDAFTVRALVNDCAILLPERPANTESSQASKT